MNYKKIILAFLGAVFIALFAQIDIEIPTNAINISITGQTFAILLVAILLGFKYGLISIGFYIILGLIGLPVFADASAGLSVVLGNTGGYIFGFVVGTTIVGRLGDIGWRKSLPKSILAMFIGTLFIIIFGVARLSYTFGLEKALEYGFYPFIWGGLIKIILGGLTAFLIDKYYWYKFNINS